jgi:hypothetical protein
VDWSNKVSTAPRRMWGIGNERCKMSFDEVTAFDDTKSENGFDCAGINHYLYFALVLYRRENNF